MSDDLKPLPSWKRRARELGAWWRGNRFRRQEKRRTLKTAALKLLTLAISVLGATLISYGVWQVFAPAGYVTGGFMCWLLLWSAERDKGRRE